MPRHRRKNRFTPYTKDEIKAVITLWEDKSTQEIAEELGRKTSSIGYIANAIRKEGYRLPKKTKRGTFNLLVKEVIAELALPKRR
jgi:transposase